jgi:flagellar hook-associated protein 2
MALTIGSSTPASTPTGSTSTSASSSGGSTTSGTTTYGSAGQSAAQKAITALGSGSGMDIVALAQGLTDAEKAPQMSLLDKQLKTAQNTIQGFTVVNQALSNLQSAMAALQDKSQLGSTTVRNSAPGAVQVTADPSAAPLNHSIEVLATAASQRYLSAGLASSSAAVGGAQPATLTINVGGTDHVFTPGAGKTASLDEFAAQINKAGLGITAQVFDNGSSTQRYQLLLSSDNTGAASAFTARMNDANGATVAGFDFGGSAYDAVHGGQVSAAADAHLRIDGVELWRSTNQISDALSGVQLDLMSTTGSTPATVQLSRDTSSLQTAIGNMVTAYNDVQAILKAASDPKSTAAGIGATLVANPTVTVLQTRLRTIMGATTTLSSGSNMGLIDLGISHQLDGSLGVDTAKLAKALQGNGFANAVQMLTNGKDNSADPFNDAKRGFAGNGALSMSLLISGGVDPTGHVVTSPVQDALTSLQTKVSAVQKQEADLTTRMQDVYNRYVSQFGAMDTLVGQMNSMKSWLNQLYNPNSKNNGN